jgi:hypothetical protein
MDDISGNPLRSLKERGDPTIMAMMETISEGDETREHVMQWLSKHPSIKANRRLMVQAKQPDA